jgi:hypothetical protein
MALSPYRAAFPNGGEEMEYFRMTPLQSEKLLDRISLSISKDKQIPLSDYWGHPDGYLGHPG